MNYVCFNSFHPPYSQQGPYYPIPPLQGGDCGTEKLTCLPKITELIRGRTGLDQGTASCYSLRGLLTGEIKFLFEGELEDNLAQGGQRMLSESARFMHKLQGVLELPKLYVCILSLNSPKDICLKQAMSLSFQD